MTNEPAGAVAGDLLQAGTTRTLPAAIGWEGECVVVFANNITEGFAPGDVDVSERVAGVPTRVLLPRGMVFTTRKESEIRSLIAQAGIRQPGRHLAWLEGWHWRLAGVILAAVIAIVAFLRWGLPLLAVFVALIFPHNLERQIGEHAFDTLDHVLFQPSHVPRDRRAEIRTLFAELKASAGLPDEIQLHFRSGPLGPNALAMPGGPVVITDSMVNLAENDDAIAGILGHELGHIKDRHSVQRLVLASGSAFMVAVAVGDIGEVMEEAAALPTLMLDSAYSRAFELDADAYARRLMLHTGHDPAAMAAVFEKLMEKCGPDGCGRSWLDSHPPLSQRVEKLR